MPAYHCMIHAKSLSGTATVQLVMSPPDSFGSKKSTGLTRALSNNELLLGSRVSKSLYFGRVRFHYYTFCVVIFCSLFRFSFPVTHCHFLGFRSTENARYFVRSWSWSKWGDRGGVVICWKTCWQVFLRATCGNFFLENLTPFEKFRSGEKEEARPGGGIMNRRRQNFSRKPYRLHQSCLQ